MMSQEVHFLNTVSGMQTEGLSGSDPIATLRVRRVRQFSLGVVLT